jgi:hypothetical protein
MVHHIHMYTHLDGNIKLEGRKIQSKMDYEIQNIWWSFKWDLVKGNGNCNFIMTTFSSNIFNKWVPYNFSLSFCFNREIAFSFVFYFLLGELVIGCSVYWVQILYCWLRTLLRRECKERCKSPFGLTHIYEECSPVVWTSAGPVLTLIKLLQSLYYLMSPTRLVLPQAMPSVMAGATGLQMETNTDLNLS